MATTRKAARLTTGVAALAAGLLAHHLRQLAEDGRVPGERAGRFWTFRREDVPTIRKAAEAAGFLKAEV